MLVNVGEFQVGIRRRMVTTGMTAISSAPLARVKPMGLHSLPMTLLAVVSISSDGPFFSRRMASTWVRLHISRTETFLSSVLF